MLAETVLVVCDSIGRGRTDGELAGGELLECREEEKN